MNRDPAFGLPGLSSFSEFLAQAAPDLLPARGRGAAVPAVALGAGELAPTGTTIVALTHPAGVVVAGDRRATMGNVIAQRDIEKVFPADDFSAVGIAGSAGIAGEVVRLFQVELEHYEKVEGITLSLDGKANRLATMIRGNLGMAMQGLAVVPLFAGWDHDSAGGRIFSYDVTGGRYEEHSFYAVGSGAMFARGSLRKGFRSDLSREEAVGLAVEALYDAADDDSSTGGPDLTRGIYPVVADVGEHGYRRMPDEAIAGVVNDLVERRRANPAG